MQQLRKLNLFKNCCKLEVVHRPRGIYDLSFLWFLSYNKIETKIASKRNRTIELS